MKVYDMLIIPIQFAMTLYLLRVFKPILDSVTYKMLVVALALDILAMFDHALFPLSSFMIIVTILKFYDRGMWSIMYAIAANFAMYLVYSNVPMGGYFVTAVNYYIGYALMSSITRDAYFLKNVFYYASLKHLVIAAGYWLMAHKVSNYISGGLSVVIMYYMVRATLYYFKHFEGYHGTKIPIKHQAK